MYVYTISIGSLNNPQHLQIHETNRYDNFCTAFDEINTICNKLVSYRQNWDFLPSFGEDLKIYVYQYQKNKDKKEEDEDEEGILVAVKELANSTSENNQIKN